MAKWIPLTKGQSALVDDADYEWLSRWKWSAHRSRPDAPYYAVRSAMVDGKQRTIQMHRLIMDAPDGVQVDHENRKALDNQRANLRLATHAQNQQNQVVDARNAIGYKGVSLFYGKGDQSPRYRAAIHAEGRRSDLGYFDTAEEAARAYDAAARTSHGNFAQLNFPDRIHAAPPRRVAKRRNSTSGYMGVTFNKQSGRWRAQVTEHGKRRFVGSFGTAEEAARAYDAVASAVYGERARINFPHE